MGERNERSRPKSAPMPATEVQRRREAIAYARQLRSANLFVWAEHWERWANGSPNEPQPPNYHTDNVEQDPRTKTYSGTLRSPMGDDQYYVFMNREANRNFSTTGFRAGGGNGSQCVASCEGCAEDVGPKQDEITNAELGQMLDNKGHPALLLKKLRDLQQRFPEYYKRPDGSLL